VDGADPRRFDETRNAAPALLERARQIRSGRYERPDKGLESPRKK
jgi:hypothetical protein